MRYNDGQHFKVQFSGGKTLLKDRRGSVLAVAEGKHMEGNVLMQYFSGVELEEEYDLHKACFDLAKKGIFIFNRGRWGDTQISLQVWQNATKLEEEPIAPPPQDPTPKIPSDDNPYKEGSRAFHAHNAIETAKAIQKPYQKLMDSIHALPCPSGVRKALVEVSFSIQNISEWEIPPELKKAAQKEKPPQRVANHFQEK